MTTINDSNYEVWLLRYAEQELSGDERTAVEQWLAEHPVIAEEMAFYMEAPRLTRDDDEHYGGELPHQSQPLWPVVLRWSAAAAVLVAILLPAVLTLTKPTGEHPIYIAQTKPIMMPEFEVIAEMPVVAPVRPASPTRQSVAPVASNVDEYVAIDDNSDELPEKQQEEVVQEVQEKIPTVQYVDDLIVFDEGPASPTEFVDATEVTYSHTEGGLNPIGFFISTFINANK